jgi:hypothetical protein
MSNGYEWTLEKYSPDQPRVPPGDPRGGQWTATGGGGGISYTVAADTRTSAEGYARSSIRNLAKDKHISEKEAEALVLERLEKDLYNPIIIHRSREASGKILVDGRFKSQFETMTSGGTFHPQMRMYAEKEGLGVPLDIDPKLRPIYAAVGAEGTNLSCYGDVEWILKDTVKQRATITLGDSLYGFDSRSQVGDPYFRPTKACFDDNADDYGLFGANEIHYIEVQIHGGLTLADVARIRVFRRPDDGRVVAQLKKVAAEKGIELEDVW